MLALQIQVWFRRHPFAAASAISTLGAFVYAVLVARNVPLLSYPADTAGILLGYVLVPFLFYTGLRNWMDQAIAASIVTAVLGYIAESAHRLENKDGMRRALSADISSIMEVIDQVDLTYLLERLSNEDAQPRRNVLITLHFSPPLCRAGRPTPRRHSIMPKHDELAACAPRLCDCGARLAAGRPPLPDARRVVTAL